MGLSRITERGGRKMKKAAFEIDCGSSGKQIVSGLVGKTFGYHKVSSSGISMYNVTHLITGYKVATFCYAFQARAFCLKAEKMIEDNVWVADWNTDDVATLSQNYTQVTELESEMDRLEWRKR